jgi:hypothetical protein
MCQKCFQCQVTLSVPITGGLVALPENIRLRDSRVTGIAIRKLGALTGFDKMGKTLAPDTVIEGAHISLVDQSGKELIDSPLHYFQRDNNAPPFPCFNIEQLDPTNSKITLNTSASGYANTQVIEITFGIDCSACDPQPVKI